LQVSAYSLSLSFYSSVKLVEFSIESANSSQALASLKFSIFPRASQNSSYPSPLKELAISSESPKTAFPISSP
jgi:hypothetical protein